MDDYDPVLNTWQNYYAMNAAPRIEPVEPEDIVF
jgi:hypothetical protein